MTFILYAIVIVGLSVIHYEIFDALIPITSHLIFKFLNGFPKTALAAMALFVVVRLGTFIWMITVVSTSMNKHL